MSARRAGAFAAFSVAAAPLTLAAPKAPPDDLETLMSWWTGLHDTAEQIVYTSERGFTLRPEGTQSRLHQRYARILAPAIGRHVLYLEEFRHEEPGDPKRQLVIVLEREAVASADGGEGEEGVRIRARQMRFAEPRRWRQLHLRPEAARRLRPADLVEVPGCALRFVREGNQFQGSLQRGACIDASGGVERFLDFRVLVGESLYWYRTRWVRAEDGELDEEIAGYPYFEPFEARLFSCRVRWSKSGRRADQRDLASLDLHDQGGRARFVTPDGRRFEIELHGRDGPLGFGRDALVLSLQEEGAEAPLASGWTQIDAERIGLELEWLRVTCAPVAPEDEAIRS